MYDRPPSAVHPSTNPHGSPETHALAKVLHEEECHCTNRNIEIAEQLPHPTMNESPKRLPFYLQTHAQKHKILSSALQTISPSTVTFHFVAAQSPPFPLYPLARRRHYCLPESTDQTVSHTHTSGAQAASADATGSAMRVTWLPARMIFWPAVSLTKEISLFSR